LIRGQGYFFFNKEYIRYLADSTGAGQKIKLTLQIKNPDIVVARGNDSIHINRHKRFIINNIYVNTDFSLADKEPYKKDSVKYKDYTFYYRDKLKFNPKVLAQSIFF